eukprot:407298-Rhodomonas_salina.1
MEPQRTPLVGLTGVAIRSSFPGKLDSIKFMSNPSLFEDEAVFCPGSRLTPLQFLVVFRAHLELVSVVLDHPHVPFGLVVLPCLRLLPHFRRLSLGLRCRFRINLGHGVRSRQTSLLKPR